MRSGIWKKFQFWSIFESVGSVLLALRNRVVPADVETIASEFERARFFVEKMTVSDERSTVEREKNCRSL